MSDGGVIGVCVWASVQMKECVCVGAIELLFKLLTFSAVTGGIAAPLLPSSSS